MLEITQIRRLSIWIFLIPLLAINLCLFISQNPGFLENTFFEVDQIVPFFMGKKMYEKANEPKYCLLYTSPSPRDS